jgi:amino acid transporter
MSANSFLILAAVEHAGLPALRIAFTVAAIFFLYVGVFIFRRRHQFFDRDPSVKNDVAVVRHIRVEVILFIWSALTLVLLGIVYQLWSA